MAPQNDSKMVPKGGPENGAKLGTPLRGQIVQYFRGVGPLRKGSLLGPLFGTILGTKVAQKES